MHLDTFLDDLDPLRDAHLLRKRVVVEPIADAQRPAWLRVQGREVLAFCSNDYLGLARHPKLIAAAQRGAEQWGVGATASPLVGGHWAPHEALERELAVLLGLPRALLFHSGYAANTGVIPALVGPGDVIFSDALNHACLIDGARLSRAQVRVYRHLDLAELDAALHAAASARRRLVITDAVFSMDGDIAPLPDLLALCERHDAWILVDDAHGFGVLGDAGQGSLAHFGMHQGVQAQRVRQRLVYMATLGKAAGVAGAVVAGSEAVIEWLMQRARTYMFATSAPALLAEVLRVSLQLISEDGWRRRRLQELRTQIQARAAELPGRLLPSDTAIQPLMLGASESALAWMDQLMQAGLWVPAIRPPTVPQGSARLRISLSAVHQASDVQLLLQALTSASPMPD